jgi:hypothetical protein
MTRAAEFEEPRPLLFGDRLRLLRSVSEAENAVQETWQRYELSPARPASAKTFLSAAPLNNEQGIGLLSVQGAAVRSPVQLRSELDDRCVDRSYEHAARQSA